MLSRMMCDALHETDTGDGVIFLTDKSGAAPYRAAALLSHKHACCEVISGINLSLLALMYPQRGSLSSAEFRQAIVAQGVPASAACGISSKKSSFRPAPRFV